MLIAIDTQLINVTCLSRLRLGTFPGIFSALQIFVFAFSFWSAHKVRLKIDSNLCFYWNVCNWQLTKWLPAWQKITTKRHQTTCGHADASQLQPIVCCWLKVNLDVRSLSENRVYWLCLFKEDTQHNNTLKIAKYYLAYIISFNITLPAYHTVVYTRLCCFMTIGGSTNFSFMITAALPPSHFISFIMTGKLLSDW